VINAMIDPVCLVCGCMKWISVIEPAKPLHDRRTYVCPCCDYVVTRVVQFRKKRRKEPAMAKAN
jgi:hypothetical protein